ncbi:D-alanyl-lipoteichoic acid acyltransferase DltB, MBOAT superfamily [Mesonia phycicola]|uniref:D-alanyl-lipoteichoic acid acyltransferase DltB, MBOAT superfamily n=1 Tax=Mesonia phycicola TaxID=579105 RepID=A0A1M6ANX9_9FLAO|nr:MBOAT family O-acyltransferase [Mesonia phycicola]SHI38141.1 D-alanyl-lipoteichoic acid acyltransferase DltB, MBOAT superfamily [Mesonia phycicola]
MLFNSLDFAIFLPIVFILYWLLKKQLKAQNFLIAVASYIFYGMWDWRFLFLILFSTVVDYTMGLCIEKSAEKSKKKIFLWISILVNLGFLGYFKYSNFFLENFIGAFQFFGQEVNFRGLDIVLPVGISFYTFQTLSYTIDAYRKKLKPTKDFIAFTAFVSFFPQLVAGPIERATHLLPQFYKKRKFDYSLAVDGMRQILWGLFKKVVIADNCAQFANQIFNNSGDYSGSTLVLGAVFFTFQIYGDFSGYSDIAIGTSRLFGFDLMRNFAFPYFSRDIAEFWRRWHISLSTWFRDYLYIPLGGSRGGMWMKVRNTFIIFLVSGFWHGANWTFVVWGGLNALYFLPLLLQNKNRNHIEVVAYNKNLPSLKELLSMGSTFVLTVFAWIFFRAENLGQALSYIKGIFHRSLFKIPSIIEDCEHVLLLLIFFLVIEWLGRKNQFAIAVFNAKFTRPLRWVFYSLLILIMALYMVTEETPFIYFQF